MNDSFDSNFSSNMIDNRVAALEVRIETFGRDLHEIKETIKGQYDRFDSSISKIESMLQEKTSTNWPNVWKTIGVVSSIIVLLAGLALSGPLTRLDGQATRIDRLERESWTTEQQAIFSQLLLRAFDEIDRIDNK